MISAETVNACLNLDVFKLEQLLTKNIPTAKFSEKQFLGITNAGQFCYQIKYTIERDTFTKKAFVSLDDDGRITATF